MTLSLIEPIIMQNEVRISQRNTQLPQRLQDYEIIPDSALHVESELMQLALFAEAEPLTFEEAVHDPK